jgi:hypothetical protein
MGVAGDEDPYADEAAIRGVLSRLARRLYGVHWASDSAQIDRLMNLYTALWNDRTQSGDGAGQVPGEPGERAWRGVLIAMLRSPRVITY